MADSKLSVYDIQEMEKLRRIAKYGPKAIDKYVDDNINKWKNEVVKLAITGRTATGKSTFINRIRNVKPDHPYFAKSGSGDTTTKPTPYEHPKNNKLILYDLPGVATVHFPRKKYVEEMELKKYDFFFIFFDDVMSEDDIWLAEQLYQCQKPFCFVRSKIDVDLDNAYYDGKNEEEALREIREKAITSINKHKNLEKSKAIFFISSRKQNITKDMTNLVNYIEKKIPAIKFEAVLYAIGSISDEIVEQKYEQLKTRRKWVALKYVFAQVNPFSNSAIDIFRNEIKHYIEVFGLTDRELKYLKNFQQSNLKSKLLLTSSIDFEKLLSTGLDKPGENLPKLVAFFGPVLTACFGATVGVKVAMTTVPTVAMTSAKVYSHLTSYLEDLRSDALYVNSEIAKQQQQKYTSHL